MTAIERVQNWYLQQCNGDWEHSFGMKIETLDNPGFWIKIDLEDTALENAIFEFTEHKSELDWFHIKAKDISGDSSSTSQADEGIKATVLNCACHILFVHQTMNDFHTALSDLHL